VSDRFPTEADGPQQLGDAGDGAQPRRVAPLTALAVIALAATSIGALLAELYDVTTMARFTWVITTPSLLALAVLSRSTLPNQELKKRIQVGAVGGIVGTLGYDLVRIPFAVAGYRLFAPIDSYGLLIAGADMSSPTSDTLGWLFHLSNGVTFGIMYAVVAARRHWAAGVAWGLILESAVVFSPFRERYGLSGQNVSIAIAYGAHVAYGFPLGRMVQRLDRTADTLEGLGRRPATVAIVAAATAIVLWQQPWQQSATGNAAAEISEHAGMPTAVVETTKFSPEWLRVEDGGCIHVVNRSDNRFETPQGTLEPNSEGDLCFAEGDTGVHRVKLGGTAYSGGFVYVDG
jgi:hypothetical protein